MTAPELAFRSGVSIGSIQKYMNGSRTPKIKPLHALAMALGRSDADFYAEEPPIARPFVSPAFGLRILDESVDSDLRRQAEEAIDDLNREHAQRVSRGRPAQSRTYVTSPLPGKRARMTFSEAPPSYSGAGSEESRSEPSPPRTGSAVGKSENPRRSR